MPGARVGVNAKGKKYVRGGIPGTGLYYQSSLPDAEPGQAPQSTASASPLSILNAVFVIGLLLYGMVSSTPTATPAPVAPVPQTVAPVAAPVTPKHVVKKHRRKKVVHRAPVPAAKPDEVPAAETLKPDVMGERLTRRHGLEIRGLRHCLHNASDSYKAQHGTEYAHESVFS